MWVTIRRVYVQDLMSDGEEGFTLPRDLSHDACDVTYQPREQTDACDNITFPKLRLRVVIKA